MLRKLAVFILIASMIFTGIGTVLKIMKDKTSAEVFLWIGAVSFFLSIGFLLLILYQRKPKP